MPPALLGLYGRALPPWAVAQRTSVTVQEVYGEVITVNLVRRKFREDSLRLHPDKVQQDEFKPIFKMMFQVMNTAKQRVEEAVGVAPRA